MKIKIAVVIVFSLLFGGCAVYAPAPYAGYGYAPYGGYYGVAPVVPVPVFGFGGWGYRGGFRR